MTLAKEASVQAAKPQVAGSGRVSTPVLGPLVAVPDHFWERVQQGEGCWIWTGAHVSKGYGSVWVEGHVVGAHRRAWELVYGPIPAGLHVLHHCDNPPCVRPDHLFLGTNLDNARDASAKGRYRKSQLPYQDCERCGTRFRVQNLTRPRRYCSRACGAAARRATFAKRAVLGFIPCIQCRAKVSWFREGGRWVLRDEDGAKHRCAA